MVIFQNHSSKNDTDATDNGTKINTASCINKQRRTPRAQPSVKATKNLITDFSSQFKRTSMTSTFELVAKKKKKNSAIEEKNKP